jgi:hypothetical protein
MTAQLLAIFAFGLVMTGVVYLGVVRAREVAERLAKVQAIDSQRTPSETPQRNHLRKVS